MIIPIERRLFCSELDTFLSRLAGRHTLATGTQGVQGVAAGRDLFLSHLKFNFSILKLICSYRFSLRYVTLLYIQQQVATFFFFEIYDFIYRK